MPGNTSSKKSVVARACTTRAERLERDGRTRELLIARQSATTEAGRLRLLRAAIMLNLDQTQSVAARFRGRGVDDEDLDQLAALGLVKAASRFDPAQQSSFLAYATTTMHGELQRYFRDHNAVVRPPRETSTVDQASASPVPLSVAAQLSDQGCDDWLERLETSDELRSILAQLAPRDRELLVLRFAQDLVQADIGRLMELIQVQVSRLLVRALRAARAVAHEVVDK